MKGRVGSPETEHRSSQIVEIRIQFLRDRIGPAHETLFPFFLFPNLPSEVSEIVDRTGFVATKTTGKRSICTVNGTKHLFEGMKDRPNFFLSFSDFSRNGNTNAAASDSVVPFSTLP